VDLLRCVLADGEISCEDGLAQHDLWDMWCWLGGDVLDEQGWNMAGDERWRRPWRRVIIPDEGLANVGR
jgi:hypothetical protein